MNKKHALLLSFCFMVNFLFAQNRPSYLINKGDSIGNRTTLYFTPSGREDSVYFELDTSLSFSSTIKQVRTILSGRRIEFDDLYFHKTYYLRGREYHGVQAQSWGDTLNFSTHFRAKSAAFFLDTLESSYFISRGPSTDSRLVNISSDEKFRQSADYNQVFHQSVRSDIDTIGPLRFGGTYYIRSKYINSIDTSNWLISNIEKSKKFKVKDRLDFNAPDSNGFISYIYDFSAGGLTTINDTSIQYQYHHSLSRNFDRADDSISLNDSRVYGFDISAPKAFLPGDTLFMKARAIRGDDTSQWAYNFAPYYPVVPQMVCHTEDRDSAFFGIRLPRPSWDKYLIEANNERDFSGSKTVKFDIPNLDTFSTFYKVQARLANLPIDDSVFFRIRIVSDGDTSLPMLIAERMVKSAYVFNIRYNKRAVSLSVEYASPSNTTVWRVDTNKAFNTPMYDTLNSNASVENERFGILRNLPYTDYWISMKPMNKNDTGEFYDVITRYTPYRKPNIQNAFNTDTQNVFSSVYCDPIPGSHGYVFQFSENRQFSNPITDTTDFVNSFFDVEFDMDSLKSIRYETKYFWRVRAYNKRYQSRWSVLDSFVTRKELPTPEEPILITPTNKADDLWRSLYLKWESLDGADVEIQLSESPVFNANQSETNYSWTQISSKGIDSFLIPIDTRRILKYNRSYYWRVRGVNIQKSSAWSDTFSFSIIKKIRTPLLISPINVTDLSEGPVELKWQDAKAASSYDYQFGTSAVLTNAPIRNTDQRAATLDSLQKGRRYYWRVRAKNLYEKSKWSNTTFFEIEEELSLDHTANSNFTVYPNPIGNELRINTTEKIHEIRIYSINGSLIKTSNDRKYIRGLEQLRPGLYLVEVELNTGIARKMVRKK